MHNNNLIIIDCDFSRFSIFNLDSDMSKLIKYKQFDFPWKNVRIVTKFIRIYNIYVAITKFVKTGFFHFICLNNDFKPIYISKSFKIKINSDIINIEKSLIAFIYIQTSVLLKLYRYLISILNIIFL